MGFLSSVQEVAGGGGFIGGLTGANNAEASLEASKQLQDNIDRGLSEQGAFQRQAEGQLQGGINQNLDFLRQAQGVFKPSARLADPALSMLQSQGTAQGHAQGLNDILNSPNQAALLELLGSQTASDLSGLGVRRDNFGSNLSETNRLGIANQMLNQQGAAQQNLANIGLSSQGSIAELLGQQGGVAGQGGVNIANLTQQGSANRLNLLGQLGQAQAAGGLGAANAMAQGGQNLAALASGLGSTLASNRSSTPTG